MASYRDSFTFIADVQTSELWAPEQQWCLLTLGTDVKYGNRSLKNIQLFIQVIFYRMLNNNTAAIQKFLLQLGK
jgi:hypothetical protein